MSEEEETIIPPVPDLDPTEQRKQWGELLGAASDYHYDMSGQFEPEDEEDPDDMAIVARVHRAWGAAIAEAIHLIASMAEEQIEVEIDPNQGKAKNITKDVEYEQE